MVQRAETPWQSGTEGDFQAQFHKDELFQLHSAPLPCQCVPVCVSPPATSGRGQTDPHVVTMHFRTLVQVTEKMDLRMES